MSCAYGCARWLLFLFNFIFTLCGLAILIVGIIIHLQVKNVAEILEENVSFPAIALIVVGAIIFTIAFFGCCGAIRESHCMIVTFAMLLLTILVIQVAIAIFAFIKLQGVEKDVIRESYTKAFDQYWTNEDDRKVIDWTQTTFECCGVDSYKDYFTKGNGTVPGSCCDHAENSNKAICTGDYYLNGCLERTKEFLQYAGILLGGVAIGIAVIEFIGIIFALCLANSIRNAERRGYRV
ncbi:CD63 antigen-like isoform X2 [Venturia canescens]|uniref:CD63 antigen-like isoform X2 n=1 Tax=Venturia canescens TaxID=32260 RepID=UPI001C9C2C76|nr:CD63 antigen-like isoform X2 [Venturia canescens]